MSMIKQDEISGLDVTNFNNSMEQLAKLKKLRSEILQEVRIEFCKLIVEILQGTDLPLIYWTQYTQYYNDEEYSEQGLILLNQHELETCKDIFSVYYEIVDLFEEEFDVELLKEIENKKGIFDIISLLNTLEAGAEDFGMKELFGTGVQVNIYRNGDVKIDENISSY